MSNILVRRLDTSVLEERKIAPDDGFYLQDPGPDHVLVYAKTLIAFQQNRPSEGRPGPLGTILGARTGGDPDRILSGPGPILAECGVILTGKRFQKTYNNLRRLAKNLSFLERLGG